MLLFAHAEVVVLHGEAGGVAEYRYFIPVQAGDPYVTLCCERYGEVFQAQVPIRWEVVT